jgi:hypothetical protein
MKPFGQLHDGHKANVVTVAVSEPVILTEHDSNDSKSTI